MAYIRQLISRDLPETHNAFMPSVFGIPVTFTIVKFFSLPLKPPLDQLNTIFQIALIGLMASVIFAGFSCCVPKIIKSKTSIITLTLWFLMCTGFSFSSCAFSNSIQFGISITVTVFFLLMLVLYYSNRSDMWTQFYQYKSDNLNCYGVEMFFKFILYFLMCICIIVIVTLPIVLFVTSDLKKTCLVSTFLQLLPFSIWFSVAIIIYAIERE